MNDTEITEWHSFIHDMIDSKMNKSTLTTVPKVRLAANHWLMDCLYYFTKPYGQHIINHVVKTCSEAYEDYVSSHPGFNGHVHFIGFSLGGIIAYDIASMQWSEHEDGLPPWAKGDVSNTPDITVPPLGFKIKSIFTCGSPIGKKKRLFSIVYVFIPLFFFVSCRVDLSRIGLSAVSSTTTYKDTQHISSFRSAGLSSRAYGTP